MKPIVISASNEPTILKELALGLLLLGISLTGGWLAMDITHSSSELVSHWRLLSILLVQPVALAAWVFCGLPGLGLTLSSIVRAVQAGRLTLGLLGACMLAVVTALTVTWC